MGAPANPTGYMTDEPGKVNSNPFSLNTQGDFTNPVKAGDYQTIDFTGSGPGQGFKAAQDANLAQFSQAATAAGNQQAAANVRGVGGAYGSQGLAGSGAAHAAAAQGAAMPILQAQQQIAGMGQQNTNALYDQFSGIVAPQYAQQPSQLETQAQQIALMNAQTEARKQQGAS